MDRLRKQIRDIKSGEHRTWHGLLASCHWLLEAEGQQIIDWHNMYCGYPTAAVMETYDGIVTALYCSACGNNDFPAIPPEILTGLTVKNRGVEPVNNRVPYGVCEIK